MSELEKAWVRRRTDQLVAEGLAWSAAKMFALGELDKRRHQRTALPPIVGPLAQQPTLFSV